MARDRRNGIYSRGCGKIKSWWLDTIINGVRYQTRLGRGISRTVALELATVKRGAILKGEAGIGRTSKKDLTFDQAKQKFLDWVKTDKKPNTIRTYTACFSYLSEEFSGMRLSQITPWSLEAYKKRRGEGRELTERPADISDKEWDRRCRVAKRGALVRCNRELGALKTLFNKCIAWGFFQGANPVCKIKYRKEERTRLRFLETDEEERLLNASREPLRSIILLGIHTGLRIQAEALTLQWSSVDFRRALLTVEAAYAKNGRTRTVPLNSTVLEVLKRLKETSTSESVFPYQSIGTSFRYAARRAKLTGVTPHTLRHTFASRLVMAGVDLRTVQELGGWQTLAMVERYAHLSPAHKAQAVERIALKTPSEPGKSVLIAEM